jgi:hypothetical protein
LLVRAYLPLNLNDLADDTPELLRMNAPDHPDPPGADPAGAAG